MSDWSRVFHGSWHSAPPLIPAQIIGRQLMKTILQATNYLLMMLPTILLMVGHLSHILWLETRIVETLEV